MSMRRLLMVGGGSGPTEPGGGIPTDPTLTEARYVTRPYSMNVNAHPITHTGGDSFELVNPVTIREDCADLQLVFSGTSESATTYQYAWRKGSSGPWAPVLFGGVDGVTFADAASHQTSDPLGDFNTGDQIRFRAYAAAGQYVPEGGSTAKATVIAGSDQRLASSWTPTEPFEIGAPFPIAFVGKSRTSVISPAVDGDSIAYDAAWWRDALAANGLAGANFGVPVLRFSARTVTGALAGATHVLSQYGVNNLNAGEGGSSLWAEAVAHYAYLDGLKPAVPIWQTTPTPIVGGDTTTLGGQTLDSDLNTRRQAWIAFLRDGAPCHPDTKAQLAVGATGTVIRAGQTGHPLKGIVDIAAAVEQGGSSSPTGKWRVDLGTIGGDGVHPNALGNTIMVPPVQAWAASLT